MVSIFLGILPLRYSLQSKLKLTIWRRAGLIVLGLAALFAWSGLYLGPAALITAALVPPYTTKSK
jgi:hypothetical protein